MTHNWKWIAGLVILGLVSCETAGDPEYEQAAVAAADRFVQLIDNDQYDLTWDMAADTFKKSGTKEEWLAMLHMVRKPLGKVLSRTLKTAKHKTRLPGADPGQYVVVQYETDFENRKEITETITRMLEPDGQWRISGYYLE
jgi:hypothetical protein